MGCRPTFDLLSRNGRRVVLRNLRRGWGTPRELVVRDTFGRFMCWLAGAHIIHQTFDNGEVQSSCRCCSRWLTMVRGRWVVRRV